MHSSSPGRTPKLQLTAEKPSTGECWIPPKKITHVQGQRRTPFRKRGEILFRIKPHTRQRSGSLEFWYMLIRKGLHDQHTIKALVAELHNRLPWQKHCTHVTVLLLLGMLCVTAQGREKAEGSLHRTSP